MNSAYTLERTTSASYPINGGAMTESPTSRSRVASPSPSTLGRGYIAEAIDPASQDAYWRENFINCPYIREGMDYHDYHAAYRYGWESAVLAEGESFEESDWWMERDWPKFKGESRLNWAQARHAARDAWDRVTAPYDRRRRSWEDPLPFTFEQWRIPSRQLL